MALRKLRPTSPGQRFVVRVVRDELHKGDPYEGLLAPLRRHGGRNNAGRVTVRHQGGGSKRYYRLIDFKRDKDGVAGKVVRLEYDPNRTSYLALVLYADGERRYILAPRNVKPGDPIMSGVDAAIKPGNALPLKNIPLGTQVHCLELKPGKGAQLARSAGASVQIVAREGEYVTARLRSGEMRKVHVTAARRSARSATRSTTCARSARPARKRWRGIRPTVRGVAMNPVDHPHGGGEGKSGQGNPHPVTPWGQKTKGYKTRRNKRTAR